jgi:hypothetical protein
MGPLIIPGLSVEKIEPIEPNLNSFITEAALNVGYMIAREQLEGPTVHRASLENLQKLFRQLLRPQMIVPSGFIEVNIDG